MKNNYQAFHIYHSGVAIKKENDLFIFDYYKNSPNQGTGLSEGIIDATALEKADRVFVFASHSHHDHYNRAIFTWQEYNEQIYYILSDDIPAPDNKHSFIVSKNEQLEIAELKIQTFGSTDQGVSFLVTNKDLTIFHAGDLNWWHWKKFSQAQQKREAREFKREIEKLKGQQIDIACIPVDPRLEEFYYLAGEYLAETIKPEVIIPLHFKDNYSITKEFADKIADLQTKTAVMGTAGLITDYQ